MELSIDNVKELLREHDCLNYLDGITWIGDKIRIYFVGKGLDFVFEISCAEKVLKEEFAVIDNRPIENSIAIEIKENFPGLLKSYKEALNKRVDILEELKKQNKIIEKFEEEIKLLL